MGVKIPDNWTPRTAGESGRVFSQVLERGAKPSKRFQRLAALEKYEFRIMANTPSAWHGIYCHHRWWLMTIPGPPPKPTRLKELAGNPGHRPLNKQEPQFTNVRAPKAPADFDEPAKKLWKKLTDQLAANNLITEVDLESLTIYCRAWSQYIECQKFLKKNGLTFETENKNGSVYVQAYPQVNIAKNAALLMDRLSAKFGLTPADRARLHAPEGKNSNDDPIEGIFRRRSS